ncbi:NAD(P)/FAD-dependent oxidoreductase [Pseudonocardia sp. TRM90224]|uniref:NAD(P)/FAD-dependent oxidoreductase n=1 Tax=Pseudonocardia sp. TRM90224 TaxID=2812678 RepID=UPI001E459BEE|nr:FAD-dependent oxidoreductase [Pseudonocardia sp. TRM90224]
MIDVAVVGAGIVGAAVAYELACAGASVVVLDPVPGRCSSAGNAGLVVPSYSVPMSNPAVLLSGLRALLGGDPSVTLARPLTARTVGWLLRFAWAARPGRAWRDAGTLRGLATRSRALYDEFAAAEGVDLGLRNAGFLHVARDPAVLRSEQRTAKGLARLGVRHEVLDPAAVAGLEPGLDVSGIAGAVRFPDDAALDPERVTAAYTDAAVRHGAQLRRQTVIGVRWSGERVEAVRTEAGWVRASAFVVATGAESATVGRIFGARLPVEPGYGWSLTLPAGGPLLVHALMCADEHVVINAGPDRVRLTGGMQFGGRASDPPPPGAVAALRAAATRVLPALAEIPDAGTAWRGARPMTPSGIPMLRRAAGNVVVATGHGTLGMTLGPVTGRAVATLLTRT